MFEKIITHKGGAHRDDFLSCCIALTQNPEAMIFRQDPTPEELMDPSVLVLDVGCITIPENNSFDHHQEGDMDCTFVQYLQHLDLEHYFRAAYPWIDFTNTLDTRGPTQTMEAFDIPRESFYATLSPVESQMIQMFSDSTGVFPGDPLHLMMTLIGEQLISHAEEMGERLDMLEGAMTLTNLCGINIYSHSIKENPTLAMTKWLEGRDAGVTICPDDRGDGWMLYRVDDHPRVNFSVIEDDDNVIFAHKGGFIAKTKPMSLPEAMVLVERSIS